MSAEWEEYTGSDEQIDEMCNSIDGYVLKLSDGTTTELSIGGPYRDSESDTYHGLQISHYLICNPHPLADMICQQARTGQPVWVRYTLEWDRRSDTVEIDCTTTPDWNIPNAEYSFTPFEAEV